MWLMAAVATAICFGTNNSIFKWSTTRHLSKVNIQFFFYLAAFIITMSYGTSTHSFRPSILSVIMGITIGILNANGNIQMARAFEKGPASLTSPLVAANAIFPVLAAGVIFHESIPLLHWIGIVCMLGSAVIIQYSPHKGTDTNYAPWIVRVALAIVSFGLLGILMKGSSYLHIHSLDVLVSMYGGGCAYLSAWLGREKVNVQEVATGATVGLLSVIGFSCYYFALTTGIASIVFPVVSLNCLIVMLAGLYLFNERLKIYQVFGIFAALLGLVMTKL
ncbi:DMT family transporter [Aneurinibacillus sp. Ricciae_BoGa-3]|uniref:DMT family transporter n=1 Tax=Aneurinibacillus sp. Ricciae_BoGa-3 TaxID=3022697 RepID=UPI002341A360|nr:DMT family transporter [Aneurinibacillus sp. Ricciae_BoGa-3]WCK54043.1 DMT family transporter [Aneurinibacillus sp. Ricciae_BoGa-3]